MNCSRCGAAGVNLKPIWMVRPGGHSWATLPDFTDATPPTTVEQVCGSCVTDKEFVLELGPVVRFALGALIRVAAKNDTDGDHLRSLEIARAYFMVRNNDPDERGRQQALRVIGL